MKYFSTFSGIGGFEIGIQNAYRSALGSLTVNTARELEERIRLFTETGKDIGSEKGFSSQRITDIINERPLCVGYSEIDKYASSVYERNFPGTKNYGDITKINAEELPDFDCLVGGFPCQAFSIAGKRRGFDDTRGTLFFDLARILKEKQPRLFVFENVKGLLSHDNGNTFRTIVATIDELGYDCQWQVLNSKNHGVPQNRERIYIVGHLRGSARLQVFPFGENSNPAVKLQGYTANTLTARYEAAQAVGTYVANTLSTGQSHTVGTYIGESERDAQKIEIRRLTPKECERLQAFPDDWTKYDRDGKLVSDTQRYKMCGNAVTTSVVQAVFERIFA